MLLAKENCDDSNVSLIHFQCCTKFNLYKCAQCGTLYLFSIQCVLCKIIVLFCLAFFLLFFKRKIKYTSHLFMSQAANFVFALQNTFDSYDKIVSLCRVKEKKTDEKRGETQPRWIKRAKPIEEWSLSFQKHARKTYTAGKKWRFYHCIFHLFFLLVLAPTILSLLLLLFDFLKMALHLIFFLFSFAAKKGNRL